MQLAAFLCVICAICGRIHARGLKQSAQMKPQCLPQISLIYADKPQNHTNLTNCLSLRINAACCIPLRDLRYLRENNTQEYSIYIAPNETTVSLADHADNRSRNNNNDSWRNPIYFYRLFTFRYIALLILSALKFTSIPKRLLASLR